MFADSVLKALANYPIIESAVALLILLVGYRATREGKKDGPSPGPSYPSTHEFPLWVLTGPVHDALVHIAATKHETTRCRELLEEIAKQELRQTHLLEFIWNENMINPRRLQE